MHILFFDDDPKRHEQFRQLCREAGISQGAIEGAHSIEKAKYFFATQSFDWAFLDHDLDGQVMVQPGERTVIVPLGHRYEQALQALSGYGRAST